MADSTGTILRGSRHCPENSKFFSTSRLDPGHSIVGRTQRETGQVRPRWFGQDLSEVPDLGIGHTQDNRTDQNNEVWCEPDTYQPTSSQPIRRKRRAGDWLETRSDIDRRVRREGTQWGTPRKRALFGPDGPDSLSSGSDVAEAQLGWLPDYEYPAVAQSGRPYEDEYLEEARSPRVELVDAAARLQRELAEFRTEFGIPDGVRIRRRQMVGEFFPDHEGVWIYVDVGALVFGEVQLGPISAKYSDVIMAHSGGMCVLWS